jgi:hypothetical protein
MTMGTNKKNRKEDDGSEETSAHTQAKAFRISVRNHLDRPFSAAGCVAVAVGAEIASEMVKAEVSARQGGHQLFFDGENSQNTQRRGL